MSRAGDQSLFRAGARRLLCGTLIVLALVFDSRAAPPNAETAVSSCERAQSSIHIAIDQNENLYWNCNPVDAQNVPGLLKSALRHGMPPAAQITLLADGAVRFHPVGEVLRQLQAASIRQVRMGITPPGVPVYANSALTPSLSTMARFEVDAAASIPSGAVLVEVDYDGTLLLRGKVVGADDLGRGLNAVLRKGPGTVIKVRPNRLAHYSDVFKVLLAIDRLGGRDTALVFSANGAP